MFLFLNDPELDRKYCDAGRHHLCFGVGLAWLCCVAGKENLGLEVLKHTIEMVFIPMFLSMYLLPFFWLYRLAVRAIRWFKGM